MAVKISNLPDATVLQDDNLIPVVQANATRKTTFGAIKQQILAAAPGTGDVDLSAYRTAAAQDVIDAAKASNKLILSDPAPDSSLPQAISQPAEVKTWQQTVWNKLRWLFEITDTVNGRFQLKPTDTVSLKFLQMAQPADSEVSSEGGDRWYCTADNTLYFAEWSGVDLDHVNWIPDQMFNSSIYEYNSSRYLYCNGELVMISDAAGSSSETPSGSDDFQTAFEIQIINGILKYIYANAPVFEDSTNDPDYKYQTRLEVANSTAQRYSMLTTAQVQEIFADFDRVDFIEIIQEPSSLPFDLTGLEGGSDVNAGLQRARIFNFHDSYHIETVKNGAFNVYTDNIPDVSQVGFSNNSSSLGNFYYVCVQKSAG